MDSEPFAVLPFPEAFRIGNVFSMIVYDLDYEDIEYGYRMDGPFDPEKMKWYKTAYTYGDNRKEEKINGSGITLAPGSLMVIIGK